MIEPFLVEVILSCKAAISEAKNGEPQTYDVWRVGSGEDADIDTVDLRNLIIALEGSKKYLRGQVPVKYFKGTATLDVNITKFFQIDGLQPKLPYFKFNELNEWNDTVGADTEWNDDGYISRETRDGMLEAMGYPPGREMIYDPAHPDSWSAEVEDTSVTDLVSGNTRRFPNRAVLRLREMLGPGSYSYHDITLARLTPISGQPCGFNFVRQYGLRISPDSSVADTVPSPGSGRVELKGCRVRDGKAEHAGWIDVKIKGPFHFTDAAGNKTIGVEEVNDIDTLLDLKGKIVFPDPTFGGILPGLSNDNFWETLTKIGEGGGDGVKWVCKEDPEFGFETDCRRQLPGNPSDLDYLVYYLDWFDGLL